MDLTLADTLFNSGFLYSAAMLTQTEMLQAIHKRGGQRSHTQATVVLSPWHRPDTLSLVTCLSVRLSVHQTRLPMRPCSNVTTSLSVGLTLTHTQK